MKNIGNTICIATEYNKPKKHDGDEFMREMHLFKKYMKHKDNWIVEEKLKSRYNLRNNIEYILKDNPSYQNLIFFMHGSWRALLGAEYNIWSCWRLAETIKETANLFKQINIVLYACSCGRGKDKWNRIHEFNTASNWEMRGEFGFAMRLANDLSELGIHDYQIYAHIGSGHTTKYPHCVRITEFHKLIMRRKIVPYYSWISTNFKNKYQWNRWKKYIQKTKTGRFEAPFLTDIELAKVIGK